MNRVPAAFFAEVARDCWMRRPAQWSQPFATPYASEDEVMAGLLALREALERGDDSTRPRVFSGDRQIGFSLDRHLPTAEDVDLAGFEARLRAERSGPDTGMVIGEFARLTPALWGRAMDFLRGLYTALGAMPPGGAHAEVFFGDYARSFFGLHKDRLETFTFIVRGRKRFLLWPYEALADQPGVLADRPLHAFNFDDIDLSALRPGACILEGGPGDVLFWPASAWHVAEEAAPGFVTTLTLAVAPSTMLAAGSPLRIAAEGFDEAGRDAYYTLDPALPLPHSPPGGRAGVLAVEAALQRVLVDPTFVAARRAAALGWLSTQGFARGPERLELAPLDRRDRLRVCSPILVLEADESTLVAAANGILLSSTPPFLPLVEALTLGRVIGVGDLVDSLRAAQPEGPDEGALIEALRHLVAAHALLAAP